MERIIKFRAWDSYQKIMYQWNEIGELDQAMNLSLWNSLNSLVPQITIMQFTGLLDSKGVEIYEGDIIKCDDSNEDHEEFLTEVWFCNGQFLTKHYGFPVHSWSGKEKSWCEVIGNIYSDPHLLKGQI